MLLQINQGSIPGRVSLKTQKLVHDDALLGTYYKVKIKGNVKQSRELNSILPYGVVAIEKKTFGSTSIMIANFTFMILNTKYIFLVRWGCRIHWHLLCRGVIPHQQVSCEWL